MPMIDNKEQIRQIEAGLEQIKSEKDDPLIMEPFMKDFSLRFCWSSNALEGNTLDPVSYTHLDVYKRQDQCGRYGDGGACGWGKSGLLSGDCRRIGY